MMLRKSKDITRSYLYGSLYFHILDGFGSFQYFNTCEVICHPFLYCIMKIKPFVRILTFFMTSFPVVHISPTCVFLITVMQ